MALSNNDIFKKLRVALKLRDEEIVNILALVDFKVTKSEIGSFFRNEKHPKYVKLLTALINNEVIRSCMLLIEDVAGKEIITIEGLSNGEILHPIQQAFVKHDALQCGFCTPGMIMNAYGLLLKNPTPTRIEVIEGMEENLCRCGSYNRIIDAIQTAGKEMNSKI